MKVFITRQVPEEGLVLLRKEVDLEIWPGRTPPPRDVLLEYAKQVDGMFTMLTDRVDAEMIAEAKNLKVISNYAVGFDNVAVDAATKHGVVVTNTPGVLTETTADLAFSLLMATARRIVEGDYLVRRGDWVAWEPDLLLGQDIYGAKLGILGLGGIGQAMARRAAGFSMEISYWNRTRRPDLEESLGLRYAEIDEIMQESDYISLHLPLNDGTKNMVSKERIAMMKKSAILINTARGGLVDNDALYLALKERRIAGAGLDVFPKEPISSDNPFVQLGNVVLAPHIGSASVQTRTRMVRMVVDDLLAVLRGEKPERLVNPEVWEVRKSIRS